MKVLVTGGAGYVGSATSQALIQHGHTPVILDSLLSGREYFVEDKIFYKADILDYEMLNQIFKDHSDIKYVIHCAEKAMVDNSVFNPYEYYISNVVKSLELYKHLLEHHCKNMIFCSSASIYDDAAGYMVTEDSPIYPKSPFSRSKYITELVLQDFCNAYGMRCITLRHFNPIGAAPDMSTGLEQSNSSNIISRLISAVNEDVQFTINGTDWSTRDGTCIRDYVHVWDVALAQVKAIENYDTAFEIAGAGDGYLPINVGSGIGTTVKEVILAFENIICQKVNVHYGPRRAGDISGSYSNNELAKKCLGWESALSMEEAILDAIRWEDKKKDDMIKNM